MTQKDKELLLKDLCSRLPYGVKVQTTYINPQTKERKDIGTDVLSTVEISLLIDGYYEPKPYLFPLSRIYDNEELGKEFDSLIELELKAINDEIAPTQTTEFEVDFYNKHHLDWRGLIPMGLAIDATGLNIY
jgi:hypothetical protein